MRHAMRGCDLQKHVDNSAFCRLAWGRTLAELDLNFPTEDFEEYSQVELVLAGVGVMHQEAGMA